MFLFFFFAVVYPVLFDLQSSPKTSINNNNNEKPQGPVSLDFLRSAPKSTPTSGSYQYQMRRRLVIDPECPESCDTSYNANDFCYNTNFLKIVAPFFTFHSFNWDCLSFLFISYFDLTVFCFVFLCYSHLWPMAYSNLIFVCLVRLYVSFKKYQFGHCFL